MVLGIVFPFLISPFFNSKIFNTPSSLKTEAMHMHPCTVIWDLERSACHLEIRHKGSILNKYPSFAALIVFLFYFLIQSVLLSTKWAKLREIVGKVEEEEPEGETVVGPSGKATIHNSGITLSPFSFLLLLIYVYTYIYI